jgi:GNAT superfamily N-acetyltransferase
MAIEVREAGAADASAFRDLRLDALEQAPDAYRQLHADEVDVPLDGWEAFLSRNLNDRDAGIFLAVSNDEPVGVVFVGVDREAEMMLISDMWVDPMQRRGGIAHALVVAATEWGCRRSARVARLAVTVTNEAAERLFLECEFVPTGETEPLREGSGVIVAWMQRTLID